MLTGSSKAVETHNSVLFCNWFFVRCYCHHEM